MPGLGVVLVKPGVEFATIAPGGFRILLAITQTAQQLAVNLTITSGTDGEHSGPEDPHKRGEAYDLRSQDLGDLQEKVIATITGILGWDRFYAFLEDPGTPNEHFHIQVKKGTTYP